VGAPHSALVPGGGAAGASSACARVVAWVPPKRVSLHVQGIVPASGRSALVPCFSCRRPVSPLPLATGGCHGAGGGADSALGKTPGAVVDRRFARRRLPPPVAGQRPAGHVRSDVWRLSEEPHWASRVQDVGEMCVVALHLRRGVGEHHDLMPSGACFHAACKSGWAEGLRAKGSADGAKGRTGCEVGEQQGGGGPRGGLASWPRAHGGRAAGAGQRGPPAARRPWTSAAGAAGARGQGSGAGLEGGAGEGLHVRARMRVGGHPGDVCRLTVRRQPGEGGSRG